MKSLQIPSLSKSLLEPYFLLCKASICLYVTPFHGQMTQATVREFSLASQSWGILRTLWTREGTTTTTQTARKIRTMKKLESTCMPEPRRCRLSDVFKIPEGSLSVSRKSLLGSKNSVSSCPDNAVDQTCCWCCWDSSASQGTTVRLDRLLRLLLDSE